MFRSLTQRVLPLVVFAAVTLSVRAGDWPHWLGPNSNGSSPETGLLLDWPKAGPKVQWKVAGGQGYSSVAVAGGRAYTIVQRKNDEIVLCLDVKDGKEVWQKKIGPGFNESHGNGPRTTPTIEGDKVYIQSVNGPLVCMKAGNGDIIWQHDILKDFNGKLPEWAMCGSPVIDGDLVLVIPGGEGASVAAYHKTTGKVVWKTGDDPAGYSTPVAATVDGKRVAIFFTGASLLAVDSETGKQLWRVPWEIEFKCNICTPIVVGKQQLFVSSGEKVGCALFNLSTKTPTVAWESKGPKGIMTNYWANAVVHEGHLYGLSGEFDRVINLNCVDLAKGKLVWSQERYGKGSITLAEGHLIITTKTGDLVLAPASPKGYTEKARIKGLMGDNRTVPTIADKKLFVRDTKNIWCLDLAR